MSQAAIESTLPLTPLVKFKTSGRCPCEPYHLIFHHRQSLEQSGAIVKFGRRWLVDEPLFFDWLRKNGKNASRVNNKETNNKARIRT